MTQEEKAKRYDEALKAAVVAHKDEDKHLKATLERIFPELKESEDERIFEEIYKDLHTYYMMQMDKFVLTDIKEIWDDKWSKAKAWLEKQSKKSKVEQAMREVEEKADAFTEAHKGETSDEILAQMRGEQKPYGQREECFDCQFNYAGECKGYCDMKRSEQKSANKVEPKFHKGEWVVNNITFNSCHVLKVEHGQYVCDDCSFPITKENEYHLWTIQDAKDGDVLYECNEKKPFIFKELKTKHIGDIASYCDIFNGIFNPNEDSWTTLDIVPATKEQRDLLFQKIKEAGYVWDSVKKELKKIEQKPAWSEEDELVINGLISICDEAKRHASHAKYTYLEGLKSWLNSFKNRVVPQSKQEWSEEDDDEAWLNDIICKVESDCILNKDEKNWLKSLRTQNRWKPSDEQLEVLAKYVELVNINNTGNEVLKELLEQLKKLKD